MIRVFRMRDPRYNVKGLPAVSVPPAISGNFIGITSFLLCILAGCAIYDKPKDPDVVRVPVSVPCVAEVPKSVEIKTQAEIKALGEYAGTLRIWTERGRLIDENAELRAILQACVKP